jgi:hypothetical protein
MQSEQQPSEQLDLLWGAQAIADFLGTTERKVWYQADRGLLPVKKQGRLLTASKSALRKHFETPAAPAPIATSSGERPPCTKVDQHATAASL